MEIRSLQSSLTLETSWSFAALCNFTQTAIVVIRDQQASGDKVEMRDLECDKRNPAVWAGIGSSIGSVAIDKDEYPRE